MKHLSTLLVAVCATAALSAQNAPCELAVNGNFETGDFTGWQLFTAPGQTSIVTGNNSAFAGCIDNQVAPSASLIKNANIGQGIVVPGETITVSFDARGTTANGGVVFPELFSEINGGGVSRSVILGGGPLGLNADPNVWTTFTFTDIAGPDVSGGITLQLGAITGAVTGSVSNVCFDNVSVTVDRPAASRANYGAGWPGTNGVPSLDLDVNPIIGSTVNFQLGNASGASTNGGIVIGLQGNTPTPFGGTLLVAPVIGLSVGLGAQGGTLSLPIPADSSLCGISVFSQLLHVDAGASAGIAFSAGLQLNLGG